MRFSRMWCEKWHVCPSWSKVAVDMDQHVLIGSATYLKRWHFPGRYLHSNCVLCSLEQQRWRIIFPPLRSVIRRKVLNLGQVSIIYIRSWHIHIITTISQTGWWEMPKLSKRRRFREWSLRMIRTMEQYDTAPWCVVVGKHAANTLCRGSAIRGLFPALRGVTYSLASLCARCGIHCPSGVGPGSHFYHFISTSIIKLVYWVRQHRRFILLAVPCTITSLPTHWDTPPSHCGLALVLHITEEPNQGSSKGCKNEIRMEIIWYSGAKGTIKTICSNPAMHKKFFSCSIKVLINFLFPVCAVGWIGCCISVICHDNLCNTTPDYWHPLFSVIVTCSWGCWDTPRTSKCRCSAVFSVFTVMTNSKTFNSYRVSARFVSHY